MRNDLPPLRRPKWGFDSVSLDVKPGMEIDLICKIFKKKVALSGIQKAVATWREQPTTRARRRQKRKGYKKGDS